MAAPKLRRYAALTGGAANTIEGVTPVVGAGRALVVGKVTVANAAGVALTFTLRIGAGNSVALSVALNPGEVYTETNLVILAGERLEHSCSVAGGIVTHVYGQEVDD